MLSLLLSAGDDFQAVLELVFAQVWRVEVAV